MATKKARLPTVDNWVQLKISDEDELECSHLAVIVVLIVVVVVLALIVIVVVVVVVVDVRLLAGGVSECRQSSQLYSAVDVTVSVACTQPPIPSICY